MNDFTTWEALATFAGAMAMVTAITQLLKPYKWFVGREQMLSYVLSVIILNLASAFTVGLSLDQMVLTLFNAAILALASNGGFDALKSIFGKTEYSGVLEESEEGPRIRITEDTESMLEKDTLKIKVNK